MFHTIKSYTLDMLHALSKASWQKIGTYFVMYLLPVILFVELADEVKEQETLPFDNGILYFIRGYQTPFSDALAVTVTDFGYVWWVGGVTLISLILLLYKRQRRNAAILLAGVAGSAVINLILKTFFQRDRPELWERIVVENSFSFPSGHAMASCSLAVACMVIFWPTRWRWLAIVLGGLYMILIAWTRMYLGVHYPSDIAAGWLIASAWVLIVAGVVRHWQITK